MLQLIWPLQAAALGLQLIALWQQLSGLRAGEMDREASRRALIAKFTSAAALGVLSLVLFLSAAGVLDPVGPGVVIASVVASGATIGVAGVGLIVQRQAWRRRVARRREARRAAAAEGGVEQITYGQWLGQFRSLAEQVGVIARCSSRPALVQVGHHTDKLCKHLTASAHRWATEEFPCDPEDAKDINSQIGAVAALQFLLLASIEDSMTSPVSDDDAVQLETDWSESLLALVEELEQLGEQFLIEVGRAPSSSSK